MPMGLTEGRGPKTIWDNPAEIIRQLSPENPVMVFAPSVLHATARINKRWCPRGRAYSAACRAGACGAPGAGPS